MASILLEKQLVEGLPQAAAYQTVFRFHQQLFFGQGSASPQLFQRCQQALDLVWRSP